MKAKLNARSSGENVPRTLATHRDDDRRKKIDWPAYGELHLDPKNPRLADLSHTGTQASIQKVMEKEFDLQPIRDSLWRNGFFFEEPLVVVREPLSEFGGEPVLVVIEGNRRLAALKSIMENTTAYADQAARERLQKIPVVIRKHRADTLPYIGFRHVTGIKEWNSPAKAEYAHRLVDAGYTVEQIAHLIGDTTRQVDRWIRTRSLVSRANKIGLRQEDAMKVFRFSFLLTATDPPASQRWLKLELDPEKGTVRSIDDEKLKQLWTWLYGSKQRDVSPLIPESRQIHKLNRVLAVPDAAKELERTGNLDRSLVCTQPREEYVAAVLGEVRTMLQDMHAAVYLDGPLVGTKDTREHVISAKEEFRRISKALESIQKDLGL